MTRSIPAFAILGKGSIPPYHTGMSFFGELFNQPFVLVAGILAFLVSLSVHEFSHALAGYLLGDNTAKRMGRLTLNPMAHVDTWGLLMLFLVGFGWGKPVPYNPYNLKWPKWGPVIVSFAGPFSNLLMTALSVALVLFLAPQLGLDNLLIIFLLKCVQLNLVLMLFNLIPLPPLDGSNALLALLAHPRYAPIRNFIERSGPIILITLVMLDSFTNLGIFATLFNWPMRFVSDLLFTRL